MKKMLLLPFFLPLLLSVEQLPAQVFVNGKDINAMPEIAFCQVISPSTTYLIPARVRIDYGQAQGAIAFDKVTGPDRRPATVHSLAGILNFMDRNGWDFIDNFVSGDAGSGFSYHFLFRKKKSGVTGK
ncbi:MAG: hypothetical protein RLY31_670 [Bacteroidota bacterium]|jgi:hypothetical protein